VLTSSAVASEAIGVVGSNDRLSTCGHEIGLQKCILKNPSQGTDAPTRTMVARALQALVGAIWLDSQRNLSEVRRILQLLGLLQVQNATQVVA